MLEAVETFLKNNYQKLSAKRGVRYVFGPVPSRRLGLSLGVDLVRPKICSFDCIYCQLGPTSVKTVERKEYVTPGEVLKELRRYLEREPKVDYITVSGSGEPTLNSKIGLVLAGIKEMTDLPTAVLTNSSLFHLTTVRRDLALADVVAPSLDAAREASFGAVNRPHSSLRLGSIVEGLVEFSRSYRGRIWLEIMLVQGFNESEEEVSALSDAVSRIKPEKVQLNTVVRPPTEGFARPVSRERLEEIAKELGAEIIPEFTGQMQAAGDDTKERVVELLSRHPCTLSELSLVLGLGRDQVLRYVQELKRKKVISMEEVQGKEFLVLAQKGK